MTQTNCARCFIQLSRRELLRESLLCGDCERRLLALDVDHEDLRQLPLDSLDLELELDVGTLGARRPNTSLD
jgi:hypothetical protein